MIRTVMAEFQLERFSSQCQAAQLVPKAYSEDWHLADELSNVFHSIADRLRVAGTVRKKYSVRLQLKNVFSRGLRRDDLHFTLMVHKQTQNVLFDSEVVGDNAMLTRFRARVGFAHLLRPGRRSDLNGAFFPTVGFAAGDAAGEFLAGHARQLFRLEDQLLGGRAIGCNDAAQRADVAQ